MGQRTTLTAYGVPSDREKLKLLAAAEGKSESAWIIAQIRTRYAAVFEGVTGSNSCAPPGEPS